MLGYLSVVYYTLFWRLIIHRCQVLHFWYGIEVIFNQDFRNDWIKKQNFRLCWTKKWPFDWKTPFGYLVAWMGQCTGGLCVSSIYIQFSNLLIGSCWLFICIAEYIARDVADFNSIDDTVSPKHQHRIKIAENWQNNFVT